MEEYMKSFDTNWISLNGQFKFESDKITYNGSIFKDSDGQDSPILGYAMSSKYFSGGRIKMKVEFLDENDECGCDILFHYSNQTTYQQMVSIGIDKTKFSLFEFKSLKEGKWTFHQQNGDPSSLKAGVIYELELNLIGNSVKLKVNEIDVLNSLLPYSINPSQVGIWARSKSQIIIHDYIVDEVKPIVFVVMQFSDQFNDLFENVISPICQEYGYHVVRADNIYKNGLIIEDITKSIIESKLIIADITPQNPNVYYEVGYSHALNKNTILLAEEGVILPFDIAPYRVIFYKNTISGKTIVEAQLRKHLNNIK